MVKRLNNAGSITRVDKFFF